jgi:hypothetical protein
LVDDGRIGALGECWISGNALSIDALKTLAAGENDS